ncbi:jg13292 [Pararge aegeria aegeria]|uniref:Jg13292 protein n=1 Tax=Pararge aegeria aegeria TaxID=348720 RepID=A0A8S4RF17_9NEOP|nr:jg13292 [Pararge aegeria aegeria]
MNFYYYFFATALVLTFLHKSTTDNNTELVYPECGLFTPSQESIGLVFYVKINNTSDRNDYNVVITPDECCLEGDNVDCESLQIIGGCTDNVPKGETKIVLLIAPILNQFDRKGICALYIDSKTSNGQNKRDTIKISFDTTLYKNKYDFSDNYEHCQYKDDDPFNDCLPVNCDTYYNGKKPHYSRKIKRCVAIPPCAKDDDYEYPSVIYNPQTNRCIEDSLVNEDLEYIQTLGKDNGKIKRSKEVLTVNAIHPDTTDFVNNQNDILIDDIETTTTEKHEKKYIEKLRASNLIPKNKSSERSSEETNCLLIFLKKYCMDSKWTLLVLVLVIIVQCFMICTMIYCLSKTYSCCREKKVVRKFFNYRQDVSVTTPLINTSNMDTETTGYEFMTESSNNIDQKIKCYKACQKEKNTVKKSMSDDMLSKLLNRRDWRKFKSQAKPEPENHFEETKELGPENDKANNLTRDEKGSIRNETKVIFEDEKTNKPVSKITTKLVNKLIDEDTSNQRTDIKGLEENLSSEKEIKCHSYNRYDANVAEYRADLAINTAGLFDTEKSKKVTPISSGKGAQAYFSNDSIDDFLSERGMIYLAGENMSKYTFSSGSNDMKPSVTSSGSSKTSKNFVKNVFSLLTKRTKQSPSSDPGQNKDVNLELIHMSRASVYSSTNDSECTKNFIRKDSRTSF